jgi:hypothetical protein
VTNCLHVTRSRDEIFNFLVQHIHQQDKEKFKEEFDYLSAKELRHIDILMYLMSQYKFAASLLLDVVFEILNEHERELASLMKNFT